MTGPLSMSIIIAGLLLAAWCGVAAMRDRPPTAAQFIGVGVVEAGLLAWLVVAVVRWVGGEAPAETGTFVGYLIAAPLVLPFGALLAHLERTRWGSAILAFAAIVVPVLVLRLQQVWHG